MNKLVRIIYLSIGYSLVITGTLSLLIKALL